MKFISLYKTDASNWGTEGSGKGPKNHLTTDRVNNALCGRKDVVDMGGTIEYLNGKWFMVDVAQPTDQEGWVEIPGQLFRDNTCAKCYKKAFELIK